MDKIYGKYLKELRESHGYSLRAFADMVYVSKSTVQRWEQSFVPENKQILQAMSEIFGMSVEEMRKQSQERYNTIDTTTNAEPTPTEENETNDSQTNKLSSKTFIVIAIATAIFIGIFFLFIPW